MRRKGRKWLHPRASAAAGDEEEDQQPARHRWGMAQRHDDSRAMWMCDGERERAVRWVKERERGSYRPDGIRRKNGPHSNWPWWAEF